RTVDEMSALRRQLHRAGSARLRSALTGFGRAGDEHLRDPPRAATASSPPAAAVGTGADSTEDRDYTIATSAVCSAVSRLSAHLGHQSQSQGAAVDRPGVFGVDFLPAIFRLGWTLSRRSAGGNRKRLVCRLRHL